MPLKNDAFRESIARRRAQVCPTDLRISKADSFIFKDVVRCQFVFVSKTFAGHVCFTPFLSVFYHTAKRVNKQPSKVTKKGENIMAPLDVLKEIREETLDRVFEMSANRHMTLPKKGCEEDHARMTERADMLSILIDLLEH